MCSNSNLTLVLHALFLDLVWVYNNPVVTPDAEQQHADVVRVKIHPAVRFIVRWVRNMRKADPSYVIVLFTNAMSK